MRVQSVVLALLLAASSAMAASPKLPLPRVIAPNSDVSIWSSGAYDYDGAGNVAQIGNDLYRYDLVSRVTTATVAGHAHQFTYDVFGNRISAVKDGSRLSSPASLLSNHLESSVGPEVTGAVALADYDGAGNVIRRDGGLSLYTWDGANMLTSLKAPGQDEVYVYGAGEERIATISQASTATPTWSWTIREGAEVLRRFENSGAVWLWKEDYVYRDGALLASVLPNASTRHFHIDHLGSARVTTAEDGSVVARHTYQPFGEELEPPNDPERARFTGHERDASLDYLHARYYGASIGRFLSVDPGRDWDLHQPQSWNLYSYVRNNPATNRDPNGKVCVPCLGALIGGTVGIVAESIRQTHDVIYKGIPADNKKLRAAFVGGAVSGAIGASCSGCRLIMSAGAGIAGTTIGGVANRALDGQHTAKEVVDGKAMLKDGAAGAIGGVVGYGVAAKTVEPLVAANKLGESAARESAMQSNLGQGFHEIVAKQAAVKNATALSVGVATAAGETASTISGAKIPDPVLNNGH